MLKIGLVSFPFSSNLGNQLLPYIAIAILDAAKLFKQKPQCVTFEHCLSAIALLSLSLCDLKFKYKKKCLKKKVTDE